MNALTFNQEQQAAIEATGRQILVLAGAGTGKTTTIIGRCNHLISTGVPEENLLLITFTRRAASEIRSRLSSELRRRTQINATTFHSWGMKLIRRNPKLFELDSPTLIDRDDILMLFKRFRREHKDKNPPKPAEFADFHSLQVNICGTANQAAKLKEIAEGDIPLYQEASEYYRQYKAARNYIDYDDILECLANKLSNPKLAAAVGERFRHIMIDEMQDTNPLQYLIVDALAPHTNLFCVGDDAQSIYGFRGADFESIHAFKERYPAANVLKLQENYRSTQEILDVSNWLIKQSPLAYDKDLVAARGSGTMPILCDAEDRWDEADFVAHKILASFEVEDRWRNNMVLTRTGFGARAVESKFLEMKIPYVLIGGQSLFGARHVKDVMSLLRIYSNRDDELAWMRYLQLWRGLGEVTADKIFKSVALHDDGAYSTNKDELRTTIEAAAVHDQFGWTGPLLKVLETANTPVELVDAAYSSLEKPLATIYQNDNWDARKRDFEYVRELATKHRTMSRFVDEYLLNPVYESDKDRASTDDKVRIITVHSAKGLEASRCFVIDVAPGEFPRRGSTDKEVEEERRVLYVAITRAANELYITRSTRGWTQAHATQKNDRYFFSGIPKEILPSEVKTVGDESDGQAYKIKF
jgi:DNA helicase-2/ATP-dependent DNA helicase PcrA